MRLVLSGQNEIVQNIRWDAPKLLERPRKRSHRGSGV